LEKNLTHKKRKKTKQKPVARICVSGTVKYLMKKKSAAVDESKSVERRLRRVWGVKEGGGVKSVGEMPLVRYELRNELGLANPQLYRTAGKDDSQALLAGVAMAGLVGIIRQLGDLAESHELNAAAMNSPLKVCDATVSWVPRIS
jgi:hypothetical protein